jgi:hypothetical protein
MAYKLEEVEYGEFKNDKWKVLNGLDSISKTLFRITKEIDWDGYQLWIHGSILSNVNTFDIDLTILGPMNTERIMHLLREVNKIGFEEQQFTDVKYNITNDLYDINKDDAKKFLYACYSDILTINGEPYQDAKPVKDLYLKELSFPMSKTLHAIQEGIRYESPKQLV